MTEKILLTWSGGKDSALALNDVKNTNEFEMVSLLTTVTKDYDRVSMHGFRTELLELQANMLEVKLEKILISKSSSNEEYDHKMKEILEKYQEQGITQVVFGDIFLEEVRKYREENLVKVGMKGIFPLWKKDTLKLAHTFIDQGFKAVITCVDSEFLDRKFVGREFDKQFLSDLPANIDPCGENGEFHSFVYDGPVFKKRILFAKGKIVLRDKRFYYCDLLPK